MFESRDKQTCLFVMIEIYQMLGGGNMYRTLKTPFRASHTTIQQLFDIRRLSGTIWNDCVELARYYYRLGNKWITQTELQKELKRLYPLHSQTIQAVAHKFLAAREGTKKRQGKRVTKISDILGNVNLYSILNG